jgi:hypothetical protein
MRHRILPAALLLSMTLPFALSAPAQAAAPRGACEVSDPSPTPLNVRTGPFGDILRTLKDGVVVWRVGSATLDENGRPWVQVSLRKGGKPIGWVFREYISCRGQ